MTKSETALLLGLAAAYDRRTIGEADVEAWHDVLNDISFIDAKAAVKDHYRMSNDWIMPATIRAAVRKIRAERIERELPQTPPRNDMTTDEYISWLRTVRKHAADGTYAEPDLELKPRDMAALENTFRRPE
jgi:hypothetical protein